MKKIQQKTKDNILHEHFPNIDNLKVDPIKYTSTMIEVNKHNSSSKETLGQPDRQIDHSEEAITLWKALQIPVGFVQ